MVITGLQKLERFVPNPDKASFGVPSNGTIPHFTGSRLEQALGVKLTRVAYRGSAPIINDVLGGHLPFGIVTIADAIPQHRARPAHPADSPTIRCDNDERQPSPDD